MTISAANRPYSFLHLASVVIKEGEESYIHNKFKPEMLQRVSEGKKETNHWQSGSGIRLWRKRRIVEGFGKMMGKEQYVREMWEYFCQDRARLKTFREEAEEERQAGIQGSVAAGIASQRVLGASEMLQ